MEIWKDVPGYEGFYQASNFGRLRSLDRVSANGKKLTGKLLEKNQERSGYIVDILCKNKQKKTTRLHRIIALTFLENLENKPEVNHLNGDKTDNRVSNLEWATHRENTDHAWKNGLIKQPPNTPLRPVIQSYEGEIIACYRSIDTAALITGISAEDICKCCKRKRKNAGSYSWKYGEESVWVK
ncbi:MAG: NUMOD4 motif-containing HNH endonuclease [Lacrimispora sphenoides]